MLPSLRVVVPLLLLAALGVTPVRAEGVSPAKAARLIERLSFILRDRRLTLAELDALRTELGAGTDAKTAYLGRLDSWIGEAPSRFAVRNLGVPLDANIDGSFLRLSVRGTGADAVYYLPHVNADAASCATPVTVRPWWSLETPIRVCAASYRPEVSFDSVGYCGGQPEPTVPTPPRASCGCGPFMLACFPPDRDAPGLGDHFNEDIVAEIRRTVSDLTQAHHSYDELLTTSRTWQSGRVEFLYLRRELIAMLRHQAFGPTLEQTILDRLRTVHLDTPARWVERTGVYAGSGLVTTTPIIELNAPTFRALARDVLRTTLCKTFFGVNVDSDVLLRAVGEQHAALRALGSLRDSPMIKQEGCKGCHAPLDQTAAFLEQLSSPLYGFSPTGLSGKSMLFVKGADDLRGNEVGAAGLSRMIVRQPEFSRCVTSRLFRGVMQRAPLPTDHDELLALEQSFNATGRDFGRLVRTLLAGRAFTEGALP